MVAEESLSHDYRAPRGDTEAGGPPHLSLEDTGVFFHVETGEELTHKLCGQPDPKGKRGKEEGASQLSSLFPPWDWKRSFFMETIEFPQQ